MGLVEFLLLLVVLGFIFGGFSGAVTWPIGGLAALIVLVVLLVMVFGD